MTNKPCYNTVEPLKAFNEKEAREFIQQNYSNGPKDRILMMIKYWHSEKNNTQIWFRSELNKILEDKFKDEENKWL